MAFSCVACKWLSNLRPLPHEWQPTQATRLGLRGGEGRLTLMRWPTATTWPATGWWQQQQPGNFHCGASAGKRAPWSRRPPLEEPAGKVRGANVEWNGARLPTWRRLPPEWQGYQGAVHGSPPAAQGPASEDTWRCRSLPCGEGGSWAANPGSGLTAAASGVA